MNTQLLFYSLRISAVSLIFSVSLLADDIAWDGDGVPNASGEWEVGANWAGDTVPSAGDDAQLLDVTGGTRTVTISEGVPQTISQLTMKQTTIGGINILTLEDDLTISGTSAGALNVFDLDASAGADALVLNIADGSTLLMENTNTNTTSSVNAFFEGTLNLGVGSTYRVEAIGGSTSDINDGVFFSGPINATGAGAEIQYESTRGWIGDTTPDGNFVDGPVTVSGVGSSLAFRALQWNGSSSVISSFNGGLIFRGDDGAGNAVSVGTGSTLNLVAWASTFAFENNVELLAESGEDAGGILALGSSDSNAKTTTVDFLDGFDLGAGSRVEASDGSVNVNLAGTLSMAEGSEFLVKFLGSQGSVEFVNAGDFDMDGSMVNLDWAATSSNTSSGTRGFTNTGNWTLRNGASLSFISSSGRPTNGGFGFGKDNENSGTLSIESGSSLGFQDFYNTGTVNAGSSTGGVSEATVYLGSPENTFRSVSFVNGRDLEGVASAGTLNIRGNAVLGRTVYESSTTTLDNGSASSVGSSIHVGDGTTPVTFTVSNRHVVLNNYEGNQLAVRSGGTLLLTSTAPATSTGSVAINNDGTIVHAGTIQMQSNFWADRDIVTSSTGTYRVSGEEAVLEAMPGPTSGSNVLSLDFTVAGQFSGDSASDRMTYVNSSGRSSETYLNMAVTGGEITPGAGSGGSGVSSIGSLELVDANATLSSGSLMTFDIGGTQASGLYDVLTLSLDTAGSGAILDLGTDTILDIQMVNGFLPGEEQVYTIVGAASVTGTFGGLLYNGEAVTDEYSVNYLANGIEVTMSAVPEPTAFAALFGGIALGVVLLRRRKNAL
ncbi:beta strand repeat-containing protein [Puniceicoccus vermicola]|uniref:PEP-CTERM sorting domain-containing protein n=1 Tax=Puniceicoccus vermicola TaxID=388746 RepID=A0A7X1AZW9_9BACT|nr:PEP-CTERM sorting domain-containing protein [Puniceicoccus vermicola]MBC2603012.1 PEP-CTERM sorting domain-containing protein [Puniceicoccus vermicola]